MAECELQSWYQVHHVTREEFEKKVQEQRKFDLLETGGRLDAEHRVKTTFSQRANELSTGKRALQAAAAIRIETDTEQSLAKVSISSCIIFTFYRTIPMLSVVVHQPKLVTMYSCLKCVPFKCNVGLYVFQFLVSFHYTKHIV